MNLFQQAQIIQLSLSGVPTAVKGEKSVRSENDGIGVVSPGKSGMMKSRNPPRNFGGSAACHLHERYSLAGSVCEVQEEDRK